MRSIEEMKEQLIQGKLDTGVFVSHNEKGEHLIVTITKNSIEIDTWQENNWIRKNIYTYDNGIWIDEELYDR